MELITLTVICPSRGSPASYTLAPCRVCCGKTASFNFLLGALPMFVIQLMPSPPPPPALGKVPTFCKPSCANSRFVALAPATTYPPEKVLLGIVDIISSRPPLSSSICTVSHTNPSISSPHTHHEQRRVQPAPSHFLRLCRSREQQEEVL